ncbi:MAG: CDP-alcohol phosphatidyltransferase family protein, partial [Myxococcota bacterium]
MPGSGIRVFGMTLLERLLRGLRDTGVSFDDVTVDVGAQRPLPRLPADVAESLPLRWSRGTGTASARLGLACRNALGGPLLALAADTVLDTRVLAHACQATGNLAFVHGEASQRGALLRIESEPPEDSPAAASLLDIALHAIQSGAAKELAESDFAGYITMLRRNLPPYLFRVSDEENRDRVERFLFWSNYKGSTDFLTKYVYPPVVWACVRPLARWRVHPNWVTSFDWIATFAAVPLFAAGAWLPGLLLAYGMSILDSVDGKLARLTYTSSRFGEIFDHGLDIVHPPVWYMAWAWWLGGGRATSAPFQASLWLLAFYVLDRAVAG